MLASVAGGEPVRMETIRRDGALWLQIRFDELELPGRSRLEIASPDGERQTLTATVGPAPVHSAFFNGHELRLALFAEEGEAASYAIGEVVAGGVDAAVAPVVRRSPLESQCGETDDRTPSSDPRVGRLDGACTAWLLEGGVMISAGHCTRTNVTQVEFNVPLSRPNGWPVRSAVKDQYEVIQRSRRMRAGRPGDDWLVFRVKPNTETGLTPEQAQGRGFRPAPRLRPRRVRIVGYGRDDDPPGPQPPAHLNRYNLTQQEHAGPVVAAPVGPGGHWAYEADTEGGASGGPIVAIGPNGRPTDRVVGVHNDSGCAAEGGNRGTPLSNEKLWEAIQEALRER